MLRPEPECTPAAHAYPELASALLLIVYFHPLTVFGLVIDVFVLSLVIWRWPSASFLGE
jgi:hypothetical protein